MGLGHVGSGFIDGVEPEKLYPLDLERAHKKTKLQGQRRLAVAVGSESQSVLLNGEASMALIWSTRASLIEEDSGGQIKFTGIRVSFRPVPWPC